METTVLCLANSKKEGARCVAGIDVRTGQWVRPVSRHTPKGEVPLRERLVDGREPQPLDLIQMDLAHEGPTGFDYCHAKENRWIEPTPWSKLGEAGVKDLYRYICNSSRVLHSHAKYTRPDVIEAKPFIERTTLELRKVQRIGFDQSGSKWKATLTTIEGIELRGISVTDCALFEQLNAQKAIGQQGYAVISLGVPWTPPIEEWAEGPVGWKLLAAWIPAQT